MTHRALDDPAELAAAAEIIRRALARHRAREAAARETDEQATDAARTARSPHD